MGGPAVDQWPTCTTENFECMQYLSTNQISTYVKNICKIEMSQVAKFGFTKINDVTAQLARLQQSSDTPEREKDQRAPKKTNNGTSYFVEGLSL